MNEGAFGAPSRALCGVVIDVRWFSAVRSAQTVARRQRRARGRDRHQQLPFGFAFGALSGLCRSLLTPDSLGDKRAHQHTEPQSATLAAIRGAGGKAARAQAMKEVVRAIFAKGLSAEPVSELIDRLLARLSRCRVAPFVRLGRTIRKHREAILAARRPKLSDARAEALNKTKS